MLDYYGVPWEYEPTTFVLERDPEGRVTSAFTPDFYLPEQDLYVEVTVMRQALVTRKNRKLRELKRLYPEVKVKLGQTTTALYRVTNEGPAASTGIATFNVQPSLAGGYFVKLECFCFTEQTLQPGETRDSAVVFYVEPGLTGDPNVRHLESITLSYTYFPAKGGRPDVDRTIGERLPAHGVRRDDRLELVVQVDGRRVLKIDAGEHIDRNGGIGCGSFCAPRAGDDDLWLRAGLLGFRGKERGGGENGSGGQEKTRIHEIDLPFVMGTKGRW